MKQSWIIGIITIWLLILSAELVATGGTAFSSTNAVQLNGLASPAFVNNSGAISSASTAMVQIGTFFSTFVKIIFLWSPTVFAGNWIWFWEYVCLPISISFIVVIATILRGVHAS